MATEQPNVEALKSATPTPISELSPELSELSTRAIDGSVTITWPFSASKHLLAFVLADHDFRKRRNKGQLRLEFHGAAGRALDKAKIASGDAVRLSLNGANWQEQGFQPGLTGEPLGWQLKFSRKLLLCFRRLDSLSDETVVVDGEVEEEEPVPSIDNDALLYSAQDLPGKTQDEPVAPQTPLMNVSTKRLASTAFDDIEEYVSPAFLKRAKVSYGSLFEGGFEAMEEESSRRNKKGRRKSRFSMPTAAWRYSSRSPSPTPAPEQEEEAEEDGASVAEDEVTVPGFSFKANRAVSKTPEPRAATVDESIQTQDSAEELLSSAHQGRHILVEQEKDVPTQTAPNPQQPADGDILSENAPPSFESDPMPALLEVIPVPAEVLPPPSLVSQSLGFELGSAVTTSFDVSSGQGQPDMSISSSTAPGFPLSTSLHNNSLFSVESEVHTQTVTETISEPQIQAQDQDVLMDEAEQHQSDVEDSRSVSSPGSRASSVASELQSQPVETIEIPSSSPVQSPQAPPVYHSAPPPESWSLEDDAEAGVDAASEAGIVYDDEYDDEDAEGSEVDENEWTHDATPNDDREVPGEDYDLRKYDDAHEDDEEGNIDRDSLLSTDGEGNVVPANPAVVSASSSDYEEEGAALDVDDDIGEEEVDMVEVDHPVAKPVSEAVINVSDPGDDGEEQPGDVYLSGTSDLEPGLDSADEVTPSENEEGQEYDEEGYGEDEEEEEYDEEEEDQPPEPTKSQEPVFIDLLSDSDDEGGDESGRLEEDEDGEEEQVAEGEEEEEEDEIEEEHVVEEQDEDEEEGEHLVVAHDLDHAVEAGDAEAPIARNDADEDPELVQESMPPRDHLTQDAATALPMVEGDCPPAELSDTIGRQDQVSHADPEPITAPESGTLTTEDKSQTPFIAVDGEEGLSPDGVVEEEPAQQQAPFPSAFKGEHDNNVQRVSELEHDAEPMDLDSDIQAEVHPSSTKPASEVDSTSLPLSASAGVEKHDTSSAPLGQESIPVSQSEVTETLSQSQPPPSFEDVGVSQASFPTQTVIASQTQPTVLEEDAYAERLDESSITKDVEDDSQVEPPVQQLITPGETQQVEVLDNAEEEQEAAAGPEPSPGPDEQLFLEMRQYETEPRPEINADANQARLAQRPVDLITEEDELAEIEDKAEHDPTLEQKDYIITTDSLRSHDHTEDDAIADSSSKNASQATMTNATEEGNADQQEAAEQLRVPPRRSHRKTRSSGSIDMATSDGGDIASQESATQQLSQSGTISQEREASQTPMKLRTSGRRKAVQDLNVNAANTLRDSGPASATRGSRASPRGHKRRAGSDAAAEHDAPMPPSMETSPKAERLSSNKSQLLRMLQSDLPEFLPLKVLRNSLHKTVDIMAIAAVTPSASVRPRNGPRDYMLELVLTDPSTAPSTVSVAQIYRPHQKSLPIVKAGDVVLLRRFQVLSMKGRGFGIRAGDDSAWAVFEKQDEEKLPQITGPPVEVTEEEVMYAMNLAGWWEGMGEETWKKAEKAGEKAKTLSGDTK